jgi:bis(5'-adenosyl)-triphosphatase
MLLQYLFGPWPISADEVFAKTQLSYAFVNLKPIVPGKLPKHLDWVDWLQLQQTTPCKHNSAPH